MIKFSPKTFGHDLMAGLVVYVVALPLCLGIALASDAPLASGLIAGVLGGILVGALSGSHISVSGPAAGLTAVVASQIAALGSFSAFLMAVVIGGIVQVGLGIARAGFIASFFPSSVIKGLLAAIGVILVLKQIPHVLGHDTDVEGEMAFVQPDGENSFTELVASFFHIQPGAAMIGLLSIALMIGWGRIKPLKNSLIPVPLVVVAVGMALDWLLRMLGSRWVLGNAHLVQVPVSDSPQAALQLLTFPDWSQFGNPAIYMAGLTLAIVASLETLLNLDAVDKIDPEQRYSPPNRELIAQGVGNMFAGLLGGIPMTSVIVRSSVNIHAGGKTKLSAMVHGVLLLISVLFIPRLLNSIPISALAAILLMTGFKLATPALFRQMWVAGRQQFAPFIATVIVIVFTDLLTGVLVGLGVAIAFILWSSFRTPMRTFLERHISNDVLRVELGSQVGFFNRASLNKVLSEIPRGGHVLLDARNTDYIDPDILDLIYDFKSNMAPAHGVRLSMLGFADNYPQLSDRIRFVDHATHALQASLSPDAVLDLLKRGNERFLRGERLTRDLLRQIEATAPGQSPLAVIFSCIDSRAQVEHIFDLGIGDIFSVRIAGNVVSEKVLGCIEYSCKVAGAKLIVVMGHTACGAVGFAAQLKHEQKDALEATGCAHIDVLVNEIQKCIEPRSSMATEITPTYVDEIARRNVLRTMDVVRTESSTISDLLATGTIGIVGAMYDVSTGTVTFMDEGKIVVTPTGFEPVLPT